MTPTNPRIPDFVGMYMPRDTSVSSNSSIIDKPKSPNTQDAIFNFGDNKQSSNDFVVEKQEKEIPVKELSLKEQKHQAKAKLKELKEIARALKKEAEKPNATDDIKQAAKKAQKDVDEQALKTYQIRKAYAKSIGKDFGHTNKKDTPKPAANQPELKPVQNKTNEQKPASSKVDNKAGQVSQNSQVPVQQSSQNSTPVPKDYCSYEPEQTNSSQKSSQNSIPAQKDYSSYEPEYTTSSEQACFMPKENNVCDERARYSSQYELYNSTSERKTTESVPQKTAQAPVVNRSNNENVQVETKQDIPERHMEQKDSYIIQESDLAFFKDDSKPLYKNDEKIKIQNEYACNELDKASNDKMKGQFEVTKSVDGKSCEVDFDANKSNIIPEDTRNDYSSVDGKLDDYYQEIGDCFFMATLRDKDINIKDLISSQNNDNKPPYIVKFPTKNQNNAMYKLEDFSTQIVTAEDLEKLNFSTGDLEARILEVALNKAVGKSYVNKLARITQNTENEQEVKSAVDKTLKGFHYKDGLSNSSAFIYGGSTFLAKEVLTGKTHKPYVLNENNQKEIETLIQNKKITGITLSKSKINLSSGLEIIGNHEYSIVGTKINDKGEFVFVIDDNYNSKHHIKIADHEEIPLSELIKYKDFIQFE